MTPPRRVLTLEAIVECLQLRDLDVARDGQVACTVAAGCSGPGEPARSRVWVEGREPSPGPGVDARPRWSPDAATLALVDGGAARDVAPELDVTWLAWRDEATLWFAGQRGLRSMCGYAGLDGTVEELWSGDAVLRGVAAQPAGRGLVAVRESADEPPEVAALDAAPGSSWRPLSGLNRQLRDHDLPHPEPLAWRSDDGLEIEGLVVRPLDAPDGPLPLVVVVHGGPAARRAYGFPAGARHVPMLAHAGYAVLLPNPRGSTGRGQSFARAVIGDLGGGELQDVLAGVDACVAAGIADPQRLAIMGASHGGFLAAWAVTRTRRFRAAVALACLSDYLSCHYTSEIGALDEILFAGAGPVAWVERSPVTHARACTTPTLILHGADDAVCPPGQAQELYQALVEAGAETELVVYPREGHGWRERDHQLDVGRRVLAWLDRHVLGA